MSKTKLRENMDWKEFIDHLNHEHLQSVYLSGSISAIGSGAAMQKFETFRKYFRMDDIYASSTFSQLHPTKRKKIYYIRHGIKIMVDTDAVIILGDNSNSIGSKIEEDLAKDLNMPIFQILFEDLDKPESFKIKKIN